MINVVNPIANWPQGLLPKLRNKLVLTVEIHIEAPESWGKSSGGLFLAPQAIEHKVFSHKIHEVVAVSSTIYEDWSTANMKDYNYAPDLKIGQWVIIVQAQDFIHLGQKFNMCAPQFIGAIVKEPNQNYETMIKKWDNLATQQIKLVSNTEGLNV